MGMKVNKKKQKPDSMKSDIMSISVPRHIRKRMLKFQEDFFVNWSAIAVYSFKQHMDRYEGKSKKNKSKL